MNIYIQDGFAYVIFAGTLYRQRLIKNRPNGVIVEHFEWALAPMEMKEDHDAWEILKGYE